MLAKNIRFACIAVAGMCLASASPAHAQGQGSLAQPSYQLRHWNGQGLAPVYEGWDRNPDGTYNMWFGYMNRNYEETIELPVGAANRFEPGEADRGQPTFFDTRRHKDTFRVIVPANFGESAKLTWSVTVRGKTENVAGSLTSVWQIDRNRTTRGGNSQNINSNTPPVVTITPETQTIARGASATLNVSATDDGLTQAAQREWRVEADRHDRRVGQVSRSRDRHLERPETAVGQRPDVGHGQLQRPGRVRAARRD